MAVLSQRACVLPIISVTGTMFISAWFGGLVAAVRCSSSALDECGTAPADFSVSALVRCWRFVLKDVPFISAL